jgi:hypothetical protein
VQRFLARSEKLSAVAFAKLSLNGVMAAALANRNTELMENSYFRLFTANGKRKRQITVCLLQKETEN